MDLHNKPTDEELDAQIAAAVADEPNPQPPVTPPTEEPEEIKPDTPEVEEEEEVSTPGIEPDQPEEPQKPVEDLPKQPANEPDYKQKFSESSREAQVIAHSKKELELQIDEAQQLPLPTEDQLRAEFKDYDLLSDFEKEMATEVLHRRLIDRKITEIRNQQKEAEAKIDERVKVTELFVIDPDMLKKFPKLEGRQEEFKVFAAKPTRLTLDLEDAAALFSTTIPEPVKHKGQMFPTGTGGPNDRLKPADDKISLAEANILMVQDYEKYKKYLLEGKIRFDVD